MKITSMEEYGLRCMMQLAMSEEDGPVTVSRVANNEGLSNEYAGKLLNMLRQEGLVSSVRGRNGGFVLARSPESITLAEIMRVFSTNLFDTEHCDRYTGNEEICVHNSGCSLRPVWWTLSRMIHETLESISLMDLLRNEQDMQKGLSQLDSVPTGVPSEPVYEIEVGEEREIQ